MKDDDPRSLAYLTAERRHQETLTLLEKILAQCTATRQAAEHLARTADDCTSSARCYGGHGSTKKRLAVDPGNQG